MWLDQAWKALLAVVSNLVCTDYEIASTLAWPKWQKGRADGLAILLLSSSCRPASLCPWFCNLYASSRRGVNVSLVASSG